MDAFQEDHLSMEIATVEVLDNTPPEILVKLPGIVSVAAQLKENVNTLRVFKNGQRLNRTGYRMTKESLREDMTQKGFEIAADVCSYAISIGDEVLQMKVTYVLSDLEKMRDTDIADTCSDIFEYANPLVENLIEYGTNEDSLAKFKDSITLYNESLPTTRNGIVTRSIFTTRIAELFKENQELLFIIDKLVTRLRFREPVYYMDYFRNRKIVNTGHRKLSLKGKITDEQGQPIKDVKVTVEANNEFFTKTTAKGNYRFKGIEGGVWPVIFQRDGFIEEKSFLVFTPNTRVDFNVVLKRAELQERTA